jgi:predicted peptidase
MMRGTWLLLCVLVTACAHQPREPYAPGRFTRDGITLQYRLMAPPRVIAGQSYPLVVVFHGSGAIGTDNLAQIGPLAKSWAAPERRAQFPAYVLIPQFSQRSAIYANGSSTATPQLHVAFALVEQMKRELPVDASRIYALGFSMGGSAVWNALALKPGLFARAVSVAGVPNRDALAVLGDTRFLLVHGDADIENPYTDARAAYEVADKSRVDFWTYPGLGHEFPQELIATPRLAEWLFATSRTSPAPSAR